MSYPNALASGANLIRSSLLFTGSQYVTLGQPSALTSILTPTTEWTIIVRTARAAPASSGIIIAQGDNANLTFAIYSLGGSQVSCSVGGNSILSGSGTIQHPTWNTIALVNRNAGGGTFKSRLVLDGAASVAEVTSGSQVSVKDIMIGARRNSSNSDAAQFYSGNIGTIAIFHGALTDDQIHFIMGWITPQEMINEASSYAAGCPLIAYYPCNEASGTVLNEVIGGVNGTASASGLQSTVQFPVYPAVPVGDSRTVGAGSQSSNPYGYQVVGGGSGIRNGRSVYVYGFSGQNVAYIASQMALSTFSPYLNWTPIFMVGIHDLGNTSGVLSFLAAQIARFTHGRFLIMLCWGYGATGVSSGVGNPNAAGIGDWGIPARQQLDQQNQAVQAVYGGRCIDCQNLLVSTNAIPGNNDDFQIRTPINACSDNTHILDVGQILHSVQADIRMRQEGF